MRRPSPRGRAGPRAEDAPAPRTAGAPFVQQQGADVLLAIKAVPGSSRDQIAGALGDRLKVRIAAAPEAGKANAAICSLLAAALAIPARRVTIESGRTRPEKTVRIQGAVAADVARLLGA